MYYRLNDLADPEYPVGVRQCPMRALFGENVTVTGNALGVMVY